MRSRTGPVQIMRAEADLSSNRSAAAERGRHLAIRWAPSAERSCSVGNPAASRHSTRLPLGPRVPAIRIATTAAAVVEMLVALSEREPAIAPPVAGAAISAAAIVLRGARVTRHEARPRSCGCVPQPRCLVESLLRGELAWVGGRAGVWCWRGQARRCRWRLGGWRGGPSSACAAGVERASLR